MKTLLDCSNPLAVGRCLRDIFPAADSAESSIRAEG